ncbi:hypothetical protein EDB19DRAFT_1669491 [Suillus lakei]|nr:hypothetical protein EDB19DRAFT_1669491 [Suillus lakei]
MVPSWPSIVILPWSLLILALPCSPGPSFLVVLVCPDLGLDISSSLVSLFFFNFFLSPCFHLL